MITVLLDPNQMPNQSLDQQEFDNRMAVLMRDLPTLGAQINEALANSNAISGGGAYAIPYVFDTATADEDPGAGKMRLSSATQNAATTMHISLMAGGQDFSSLIDTFDASTSAVKGSIRLTKFGDLTKWLSFDITARTAPSGYRNLTVVCTGGSSPSPFANGDGVVLFFQRTGDKGDAGSLTPILHVRDEKPSGTDGGSTTIAWKERTLNTIKKNTIPGASVSDNKIDLTVAGTYRVRASAPACVASGHLASLYNVTDAIHLLTGTSEYTRAAGYTTRSRIEGEFTIHTAKKLSLRHYTMSNQDTDGLGRASNAPNVPEVYAELIIEKVS